MRQSGSNIFKIFERLEAGHRPSYVHACQCFFRTLNIHNIALVPITFAQKTVILVTASSSTGTTFSGSHLSKTSLIQQTPNYTAFQLSDQHPQLLA